MGVKLKWLVADTKMLEDTYWQLEQDALFDILFPLILAAALAGANGALQELLAIGVGVDWGLVNEAARKWARSYTYELVSGITKTTRKFLQGVVPEWIGSGTGLEALVEQLTPMFGSVRSQMIAVTETTRAFAEGNRASWRESGVVQEVRWMTMQDELVCPICGESEDGPGLDDLTADIDGNFVHPVSGNEVDGPPAHVNCRCYLQPVVKL